MIASVIELRSPIFWGVVAIVTSVTPLAVGIVLFVQWIRGK